MFRFPWYQIRSVAAVLLLFVLLVCGQTAECDDGKGNVFDPHAPVRRFDPSKLPVAPRWGSVAQWVATDALLFDSTEYKTYFYKGMAFRLLFPKGYSTSVASSRKYPLVIYFPGYEESGTPYNNENQLSHGAERFLQAREEGDYNGFVLFPQSSNDRIGFFFEQHVVLADLIENHLAVAAGVDPDRITVMGFSSGAVSAGDFAEYFPHLVSGFVIGSGYSARVFNSSGIEKLKFKHNRFLKGFLNKKDWRAMDPLIDAYLAAGGWVDSLSSRWHGHRVWQILWEGKVFFADLMIMHLANPWPLNGKATVCESVGSGTVLGITPGFEEYEWRKDGVLLAHSDSHQIEVNEPGIFDARFRRGEHWSLWSLAPVAILSNCDKETVPLSFDEFSTQVLPFPGEEKGIRIFVPGTKSTVEWLRDGEALKGKGGSQLYADTPGTYQARVVHGNGRAVLSNTLTIKGERKELERFRPRSLRATAVSENLIQLDWDPIDASEIQVEIFQAELKKRESLKIAEIEDEDESYLDVSGNANSFYDLRLIMPDGTIQIHPVSFEARTDGQGNFVNLSNLPSYVKKADHRELVRSVLERQNFDLMGTVSAGAGTFSDANVDSGGIYQYFLRAVNEDGASGFSSLDRIRSLPDLVPPPYPDTVIVSQPYAKSVEMYWSLPHEPKKVKDYKVARDGNFLIGTGKTKFLFGDIEHGEPVQLSVKALDRFGNESAWKSSAQFVPKNPGVSYSFHSYDSAAASDEQLSLLARGLSPNISLDFRLPRESYEMRWQGTFVIETSGTYSFKIDTDGNSNFRVQSFLPYDSPFQIQYESGKASDERMTAFLERGEYRFALSYRHHSKSTAERMTLLWKTPGNEDYLPVPDSAFGNMKNVLNVRKWSTRAVAHGGRVGHDGGRISLEMFQRAIAAGVDTLEIDILGTADGKAVVFHDKKISDANSVAPNPLTGALISQVIWEELRKISLKSPYASQMLSLEDVLDFARKRKVILQLDLKHREDSFVESIISLVRERQMLDRVVLQFKESKLVQLVATREPRIKTLLRVPAPEDLPAALASPAVFIELEKWFSKEAITRVHNASKKVLVNVSGSRFDVPESWKALARAGVDRIMSDHADCVQAVLR